MKRILVIRGGAIGDFVLTLPAIKLVRERWPEAHLEILGYRHIVALAEERYDAQATHSIESGPLASFFARDGDLQAELRAYFGSFDLILSYLFDPDGIFASNVRRCGNARFISGPAKLTEHEHAARQLMRPLAELGLTNGSIAARLYPSEMDRTRAAAFLGEHKQPIVALHPGSGSERKNWPIERWIELADAMRMDATLVVGGEADHGRLTAIGCRLPALFAKGLALPWVAAILERCEYFIGHDSGISHIAAAVNTPCTLLFGPTNASVWAPANENVRIIQPASRQLDDIAVDDVLATVQGRLPRAC